MTGAVHFDDVADELYGLAPERFTASRDERASEARAAGDRERAERIKKLRRPTVSAWLSNRLARDRAQDIQALIRLGRDIGAAQAGLSGDELRRLSRRRVDAVAALVTHAKELARTEGQAVSAAVLEEVTSTLEAALADRAAGEALQSGRLTGALRYSGLGLDVAPTAPAGSGRRTPTGARAGPAAAGERRSAQRAAERAATEVDRASAALEEAQEEQRMIRQRMEEAEATLQALRGGGDRGDAAGVPGPQGAPHRARDTAQDGAGARAIRVRRMAT